MNILTLAGILYYVSVEENDEQRRKVCHKRMLRVIIWRSLSMVYHDCITFGLCRIIRHPKKVFVE